MSVVYYLLGSGYACIVFESVALLLKALSIVAGAFTVAQSHV